MGPIKRQSIPKYEVISELTTNLNQTKVSYKNSVHQTYTRVSVQKRYLEESYYINEFIKTVLLRECFWYICWSFLGERQAEAASAQIEL